MKCTLIICVAFTLVDAFRTGFANAFSSLDRGFVRESEFKHARVALLALPAFAALSATGVDEPVQWLSTQPMETQLTFFTTASLVETFSLSRLGPNFSLRDGLEPGNTLGIANCSRTLIDAELSAGRAAMIGAACVMSSAFS
jgi:hypothetical protein